MSFVALKLMTFVLLLGLVPVVGWCASLMDRNPTLWLLLSIVLSPLLAALGLVVLGEGTEAR
jgi:hypothetical protein